jgi:transcriptional regulator with XRE-family HTH domain
MEILEAPSRFAEQLRARRQAERISMHRLADRSQTSVAMVCQIENGKSTPTLRTAERLAARLGASLEELLRDAGARPTSQIESTTPEEGTQHARSNSELHRR